MTAAGIDDPRAAQSAVVVDVPQPHSYSGGSPAQVVHVATAQTVDVAHPAGATHDGAGSTSVAPALRDGHPTTSLHHAAVARIFSTMYVSGSGSGVASTSGFGPLANFSAQAWSGSASGAMGGFAAMGGAGPGRSGASGSSSTSGARSGGSSGSSGAASGAGYTSNRAGQAMFAAASGAGSTSTSGSGAAGSSSSASGWIPEYLVLRDGFDVDPLATFTSTVGNESEHQHYSVTQTSSSTGLDGQLDTSVTVYDIDLTIDATQQADGSWTYSEDVLSSYTLAVTAAGSTSPVSSGSGMFDYNFSASGNGSQSQFSYSCHGMDRASGSTTQTSTSTDADGLTQTETIHEHWTNGDHYSASVTDTSDLAASTVSGTMTESGDASASTSATGLYSRAVLGGSINGTIRGSDSDDASYHRWKTVDRAANGAVSASGSGSAHETSSDDSSYSGHGSYTLTSSSGNFGDIDNGTITEQGASAGGSRETINYKLSSDGSNWLEASGSGSTSSSGTDSYSDSGSGAYSYPVDGGTISGTVHDGDSQHDSYGFHTTSTMIDGAWTASGRGHETVSGSSHFSYSGSGSYSTSSASGGRTEAISGKAHEDGHSASSFNDKTGFALASDAVTWLEASGRGSTSEDSVDNYAYSGNGSYSSPVAGGLVTGTINESGQERSTTDYKTRSHLIADAWSTSGSGTETASSGNQRSYSGDGAYNVTTFGSGSDGYIKVVGGRITESGASSDLIKDTEGFALNAAGSWIQSSGSGSTSENDEDHYAYSGNGYYDYLVNGGSVGGTITESGHSDSSDSYDTQASFSGGQWSTSGSGHQTNTSGDHSTYSGHGGYSSVNGGSDGYVETISGAISESGQSDDSFSETDKFSLNASGAWIQTAGTGSSSDDAKINESYVGSGAYSYPIDGTTVIGTLAENGFDKQSYDYHTTSAYEEGAWATEGSGSAVVSSGDQDSYQGSASYARTESGSGGYTESITGTITESGDVSNSYEQTKGYQLDASGAWTQSSGSADASAQSTAKWSYAGKGSYNDPAEGTSGTVKESGHNNRSASFTTMADFNGGAWTTSGTGTRTISSGHNDSFSGGKSVTVAASGTGSGSGTPSGSGMTGGAPAAFSGTLTEYGSSGAAYDETDGYELNAAGEWALSTGVTNTTTAKARGATLSASASYTHAVASGTIEGTIYTKVGWGNTATFTVNNSYSGGEWQKSGNGNTTESTFKGYSYSGSASFTGSGTGFSGAVDSISGTISENGHSDQAFQERDYYKLAINNSQVSGSQSAGGNSSSESSSASGGSWVQSSGLRTTNISVENDAGYSGSGPYSHSVRGGTVNGTVTEGGDNDSSSESTRYAKYNSGSGGAWNTSSGSGSQTKSSGVHWSFEGSGPYTADVSIAGGLNETVSGTVKESAGSATSVSQTDDYDLNVPQNNWIYDGSTGISKYSSWGSFSYSGFGDYSFPTDDGTFNGAVQQSGHDGGSLTLTNDATTDGDSWIVTGAGSETASSADNLSWSGGAPYAYTIDGATVSGKMKESGSSGRSYSDDLTLGWNNGAWVATSGSGSTTNEQANNYSYSGSGPYSYQVDGGVVHDTLTVSGYDRRASNFSTASELASGGWSSGGAGIETDSSGLHLAYSGSGSYSYAVPGGTVAGAVNESGAGDDTASNEDDYTLTQGLWLQTGGSGNTSQTGKVVRTYHGSGNYDDEVKGAVHEHGDEHGNYNYQTHSKYSGGVWQTTGTGNSHEDGFRLHTYAGSASNSSYTPGPGGGTAFSSTLAETGSDSATYDFNTKSLFSASGWISSGSGTASASSVATSVYNDKSVTTDNTSSSGGDSQFQSTTTHFRMDVSASNYLEQFDLVDDGWFMDSKHEGGINSDDRAYTYAATSSASSVVTHGDYAGGNGTRDVTWSQDKQSHKEDHHEGSKWSLQITAVPGGATTTTATASGGENADGTADDTLKAGHEHDQKTTFPGQASTSMSAASSTRVRHDEYHDDAIWGQHLSPGQAGGSASGTSSGGATSSGSGTVTTSGSGSFHVSGYHNEHGSAHWSGSETTSSSGSGSGAGASSTRSGSGSTSWASAGGSYSMSVDYWGFAVSPYSGGSVYFSTRQPWTGPGSPQWTGGLIMDGGVDETEPGPPGGPLAGTSPGPPPSVAEAGPMHYVPPPESLVDTGAFKPGVENESAVVDAIAKVGARLAPLLLDLSVPGWNLVATAGQTAAAVALAGQLQPTGVGHHVFQQSLAGKLADTGELTLEAYKAAEGAFTGPTDPRHGNSKAHMRYMEKVEELWEEFKTEGTNSISKANPATGEQMERFIKDKILASTDPAIQEYLDVVKQQRAAYRANNGLPPDVPLEKQTLQQWIEQGEAYIKSNAGRAARLGKLLASAAKQVKKAGLAVGGAALADALGGVAEATEEGSYYRQGLDALEEGHLNRGMELLLGSRWKPEATGFYDQLVDSGNKLAASHFEFWLMKAYDDVLKGGGIFGQAPAPPPPPPPSPGPPGFWDLYWHKWWW